MTFEEIIEYAAPGKKISVEDTDFRIDAVEKIRLASGDRLLWMWSSDGGWLIVDHDGDELIALWPVEEEVEEDESDYAAYRGDGYEQMAEDEGEMVATDGEDEHEEGDTFSVTQYEGGRNQVLRKLTWKGYGEEVWFSGKMIEEVDIREA